MKIIVEKPSVGRFVWEVPPIVAQALQRSLENAKATGHPSESLDELEAAVVDQYQHLIEGFLILLGQMVLIGGPEGIVISEMVNNNVEEMVRTSAVLLGIPPDKL